MVTTPWCGGSLEGVRVSARDKVFVATDRALGPTLAKLADALAERRVAVVRPAGSSAMRALSPEEVGDATVVVVSSRTPVSRAFMASVPALRGVVYPSIGIESCDVAAATELGVVVANGATLENVESMAEATTMLIAALRLELPVKQRHFREPRPAPGRPSGAMVAGSTVGLIGFGRIAKAVTRRLDGWGARVLSHTRTPPAKTAWPQVTFVDLPTLLAESDVVSLHLPLTAATRNLIGAKELAMMKSGSCLINTSRGGLVDERSLVDALRKGRLGGAAIDTFAVEPPAPNHPLGQCENVILTAHDVGHTRDLFDSLVPTAVENVMRILGGTVPAHVCNPAVLPRWQEPVAQ